MNRFLRIEAPRLLKPEDTFVFYFSGHGAPDPAVRTRTGAGFEKSLLVSNSDPLAVPLTSLNLTRLFELVEKLPACRKIILLDSCFAGEAGGAMLETSGEDVSEGAAGMSSMISISSSGTVLLAASSSTQVSAESDELGAGVFTHFFWTGSGTRLRRASRRG